MKMLRQAVTKRNLSNFCVRKLIWSA